MTMDLLGPAERLDDPLAAYAAVDRSPAHGPCWVMANMVGGLDGSAAIGGRVSALSTAPDAALFTAMRTLADVVLVGAETVRREGYGPLTLPRKRAETRLAAGRPAAPRLAVVSRSLDLDWEGRAFTDSKLERPPLVITCEAANAERLRQAHEVAEVVIAGEELVQPRLALDALAERGHQVVLSEGGPRLLGELVAGGHLDELCLTIAPLMGGDLLPVSVAPPGAPVVGMSLRHVLRDGDSLFLRYERNGSDEPPAGH